MKKTRKVLGCAIVILAIAVTLVGATVLPNFGSMQVKAKVKQAIVFDGKEDNSPIVHELEIYGGCSRCFKEVIRNRSPCGDGHVQFYTDYYPDGEGITTSIYGVPDEQLLMLNNKDPDTWEEIDEDGIEGALVFDPDNPTFDYTLDAKGLLEDTTYCLIYYADPWTGNNPGALLGIFTTDEAGSLSETGSVDLGMNLPDPADDNYLQGAKIWLVLASDYDTDTNEMTDWNPDDYLFEHELIGYTDCNLPVPCWLAALIGEEIVGGFTLPAQSKLDVIFCYEFAINIESGDYLIETFLDIQEPE